MKEITYAKEKLFLSPYATKSDCIQDRTVYEQPCPMRTEFQRDRDRIIHSKAFRRLKNKTQVFLAPQGDHYRTRMTHSLDVTQIARSIARALQLNEDLCEAGALGHDLGHTPFGHSGEKALADLTDGYFTHNKQSIRVVDYIEKNGEGLNLTTQVKDCILNHRTQSCGNSLESKVVMYADKIAYINHDIDDAVRAGLISINDIPSKFIDTFGLTSSMRINSMITSIYNASFNKPIVTMEQHFQADFDNLRDFLFSDVYSVNSDSEQHRKAEKLLTYLYEYYMANPLKMPQQFIDLLNRFELYIVVCDYIASMTDNYAINLFSSLILPSQWIV